MPRTNVFIEVQKQDGSKVSIGGRSAINVAVVKTCTDHRYGTSELTVEAKVGGNTYAKDRKAHGDNRYASYTVTLPEALASDVTTMQVYIEEHALLNSGIADIMKMPVTTLDEMHRITSLLGEHLPMVILPGGINLHRAIAAYMYTKYLQSQENERTVDAETAGR